MAARLTNGLRDQVSIIDYGGRTKDDVSCGASSLVATTCRNDAARAPALCVARRSRDRGRVAMPFGFALTDPGGRISRTRLFPRVTRIISWPAPKFE